MKVYLRSIGCRLNHSEIETMARQLLAAGHEIVGSPSQADKIIINSCAVTRQAAKDSRTVERHARNSNPGAEIYMAGCYASVAPARKNSESDLTHIVPNKFKSELIQMIDSRAPTEALLFDHEPILREYLGNHHGHTRAFVKVQDGCDNRCTFCITTIARGRGLSRPQADIITELQSLAKVGYKEAVLTGVHLGSYGQDLAGDSNLKKLVSTILRQTDIPRLRLSSLEPWDIEPDFFELWQDPRLQPHLHMPLQSGNDSVLRRMARRTTRKSFLELVSAARSMIPDLSLTTDLMVGFPGETDSEFESSLDFVAQVRFSRLHVFPYSRRPGTAAAKMPNQISKDLVKFRVKKMIEVGKELSLSYHKDFAGQVRDVLWEGPGKIKNGQRCWFGYTDNYIRVATESSANRTNSITPARLSSPAPDGMAGAILEPKT